MTVVIQPKLPQISRDSELDEEIDLAAAGNAVLGNQGIRYSGRENTKNELKLTSPYSS
jgi:hypothetical protein